MTDSHTPQSDPASEQDDAVIGRAFRISLAVIGVVIGVGAALAWYLNRSEQGPPTQVSPVAPVAVREFAEIQPPAVTFTDVTREVGIDFIHNNGATGLKLLPETMGGGCAVFDFDDDGDDDLLLVNSTDWPLEGASATDAHDPSAGNHRTATSVLYRNDGGKFVDVTKDSGLGVSLFAMGAAVGDYDNDGRVDVFISAVGANHLFRNLGDGKFRDVTQAMGVAGGADDWSTGCGWFDYDNDADLDLFVCNYVQWNRQYDLSQDFQIAGERAYGRPQNFEGTFASLFRNDGASGFVDVSQQAGIQITNHLTGVCLAKSLGVTFCDLDEDGYQDIIVANDTVQNLVFKNTGKGDFLEMGVPAGVAFDSSGNARGAMGIDVAAIRDCKSLALAIGNFANEMTALYVSPRGQLQFTDEAIASGLGPSTRLQLTFGIFYFDYDLDGRLDLFCANGHLEEDINRVQPSQHYAQSPQLFWNAGPKCDTEFVPVGADLCGPDLLKEMVGRGAVYWDFDDDGDLDILITSVGAAPRLLRNNLDPAQHKANNPHSVRVQLIGDGKHINRDAIGSVVQVSAGGHIYQAQVMPTRSYLSQVEKTLTFGLADTAQIDHITVKWSDGTQTTMQSPAIDQRHIIRYPQPSS